MRKTIKLIALLLLLALVPAMALAADLAVVRGGRLYGAEVQAGDLRGGAALVIAALAAEGESRVENVELIDRGYEHLEDMLAALGANIRRI